MREPNFSESQLQQAVNTAFIRHVFETSGRWVFANVPSLFDEFELGWDSAFHFPWLDHPPAPDHEGCNFFLQYKLSGQLTSAGAKEWSHWNTEYFRFKIPHSTKDNAGNFVDDYHQWDRLQELAKLNYPTFYSTNATLSKDEIKDQSAAGTLLNSIPLLDIRTVSNKHKYVTFAPSSSYFLMHSEIEKAKNFSFLNAIERLAESPRERSEKSNITLLNALEAVGGNDAIWQKDLSKIRQLDVDQFPRRIGYWLTRSRISGFVRKHVGAVMLWLPTDRY